jgi:quercetin 2,3-dioxygenase
MPEQDHGLLQGFQLGVNLPASMKMEQPSYQEYDPEQIPEEINSNGVKIRVIAGKTAKGIIGPVTGIATDAIFLDITMPKDAYYGEFIPDGHNAFIYLISGSLQLGRETVSAGQLAVLIDGDGVEFTASEDSRLLLIAGRPIGEPVARHGPFVMNKDEEIQQAYRDYERGLFGRIKEEHDQVA